MEQLAHPELPLHPQPANVRTPLNEYQQRNLSFMRKCETEQRVGGMILDQMGAGKTLTVLAYLATYGGRTLVVCPANVLRTWEAEIQKHIAPAILSYQFYYERDRHTSDYSGAQLVLTTYATLTQDHDGEQFTGFLHTTCFDRIVLDEAHHIRTLSSKQHTAVCSLMGEHRWCMTGTAIWNNLSDMYALFKFLRYYPLADADYFRHNVQGEAGCRLLFRHFLPLAICHRRREVDAIVRRAFVVSVPMAQVDREIYDKCRRLFRLKIEHLLLMYNKLSEGRIRARMQFCTIALITLLRQLASSAELLNRPAIGDVDRGCSVCWDANVSTALSPCSHRFCCQCLSHFKDLQRCPLCGQLVYERKDSLQDEPVHVFRIRAAPSAKTLTVLDLVLRQHPAEKIVVFSLWLHYIDIIEHWLARNGVQCLRIEGKITPTQRQERCSLFNTSPKYRVMLCSLTAGSEGSNLNAASVSIVCEPHWTEARVEQAQMRIDRYDQAGKQSLTCYTLISENTIEDQVNRMASQKKDMALAVMTQTAPPKDWVNRIKLMMNEIF
jgi:DNA repair protein RAD5